MVYSASSIFNVQPTQTFQARKSFQSFQPFSTVPAPFSLTSILSFKYVAVLSTSPASSVFLSYLQNVAFADLKEW